MSGFSRFVKFQKDAVNDDLGIAFGWALVCKEDGKDYVDLQGDVVPEAAMVKAAADFMIHSRVGKEMHDGPQVGEVVFAFPMTEEIAGSLGIVAEKSGLLIGFKPTDKAVLAKIKDGTYKGFSIGGRRIRDREIA